MGNTVADRMHDILSFMVIRIFAKYKKGMMSKDDFEMLATFGASTGLGIVTVNHRRAHFQELMDGELRTTLELLCNRSCGKCKGRGYVAKRHSNYVICMCVSPVWYQGDSVVELGEQYSDKYFEGEFSKDAMGKSETVQNISLAVMMFIMPKNRR